MQSYQAIIMTYKIKKYYEILYTVSRNIKYIYDLCMYIINRCQNTCITSGNVEQYVFCTSHYEGTVSCTHKSSPCQRESDTRF